MENTAVAGQWRQRESAARYFRGRYLSITSYTRDGTPVAAPFRFAEQDGLLLAVADASAGTVGRIRANPRVRVRICTAGGRPRGPETGATAEVRTGHAVPQAEELLRRKYPLGMPLAGLLQWVRQALRVGRPRTGTVLVTVTPA